MQPVFIDIIFLIVIKFNKKYINKKGVDEMKISRKIALIVTVLLIFNSLSVFAQINNSNPFGIRFYLSDSWTVDHSDEVIVEYTHWSNRNERIAIEGREDDVFFNLDVLSEQDWKEICDEIYSDYNLGQSLAKVNNVGFVNVKGQSVVTSYEVHNSVKYFRYEKYYTASAVGFYNTDFYDTVYLTVKAGRLYLMSYMRDNSSNHFMEFVEMLDSMLYDDVIKITVNGELIYPDSDPVLINDRTLVPIRAVAEKMGYYVEWDDEEEVVTLTASKGLPVLQFAIGYDIALKNFAEQISLDVPAVIIGNRTYLPLRAVAEAMDATVYWNGNTNTVEIYD